MTGSRKYTTDILFAIYRDKRTVFKLVDVALLTGESSTISLSKKLNYYVKTGKILNPRKGIYAKPDFNIKEIVAKLYTPSYLSLEYVLQRNGVIFQYSEVITAISYLSRELLIDNGQISYRKVKNAILYSWEGIQEDESGVFVALPERAFLDMSYLNPEFQFDRLKSLDKDLVARLLPIYGSASLTKRISKLLKDD